MNDSLQQHQGACGHGSRRWSWFLVALAMIAIVLLWQDHRTHMLGVIPYLILLSCPLMHLLHRRGHGHRGNHAHRT